MEIAFYNFVNTPLNRVEICLESEKDKVMVWCDEEDYYVSGNSTHRTQEVAHTLGEVLTQMIGRYR